MWAVWFKDHIHTDAYGQLAIFASRLHLPEMSTMTPKQIIHSVMACVADDSMTSEFATDRLLEELSAEGYVILKRGVKCPFDGRQAAYRHLGPEDPCPICGGLGTDNAPDLCPF